MKTIKLVPSVNGLEEFRRHHHVWMLDPVSVTLFFNSLGFALHVSFGHGYLVLGCWSFQ